MAGLYVVGQVYHCCITAVPRYTLRCSAYSTLASPSRSTSFPLLSAASSASCHATAVTSAIALER